MLNRSVVRDRDTQEVFTQQQGSVKHHRQIISKPRILPTHHNTCPCCSLVIILLNLALVSGTLYFSVPDLASVRLVIKFDFAKFADYILVHFY